MNQLLSEPGQDPVVMERVFKASPKKVFAAWTEPERVVRWFGHAPNLFTDAKIALKKDGHWRFSIPADDGGTVAFEGHYKTIEPERRLVFTWTHVVTAADGSEQRSMQSEVDLTFTQQGEGTHLRLVHKGLSQDARRNVGAGWMTAWDQLASYLTA